MGRPLASRIVLQFCLSHRVNLLAVMAVYNMMMKRTQVYLDDQLWNALHARARSRQTSISELVREAVRERYFGKQRAEAMLGLIGIREARAGSADAVEYVRRLRRGRRPRG